MSDVAAAAPAAPVASTPSSPAPAAAKPATTGPAQAPAGAAPKAAAAAPALPFQDPAPAGGETPANNNHPDAQPGETKAETIQRLKFKVKVRGQEIEREFTPEEAQLQIQKGLAFDANAQETAQIRKTFQSFIDAVKKDPFGAFNDPAFGDLGKNYKDMVIQALAKEFQAQDLKEKDPTAYELQELREYKQRIETERQERERTEGEARTKAAQAEADKRLWAETQKAWDAALEKSGLGKSPVYYKQLAQIGLEFPPEVELSPELLVAELKTRMGEQNRVVFSGLKGEALINALGEDIVREVLSTKVAAVKAAKAPPTPIEPPPAAKKPAPAAEGDEMIRTWADFKRTLR